MSDDNDDSHAALAFKKKDNEKNGSPKKLKRKRKTKLTYEKSVRNSIWANADTRQSEIENLVLGGENDILDQLATEHVKKDTELSYQDETEADNNIKIKPAWEDEDDDKIFVQDKADTYRKCHRSVSEKGNQKYNAFARDMFSKLKGSPKWAKLDKEVNTDSSAESEDELLQKAGNFLKKSLSLPKHTINIRKCQNLTEPNSRGVIIKSTEFHPTSKVALVAGLNGTATLYQVDGKVNPKIQSIHFERFPIYTAHFTADGNEIVCGAREFGHYFTYDMIAGKISKVPWEKGMEQMNVRRFKMSPDGKLIVIHGRYGNIHLVSSKSKEWIGRLKMNGEVWAIAFNGDGSRMYSHGDSGQIFVWDMNTRQCIHKINDEGCITGTALAVSPNEQYLAAGADTGVVNIYENSSLLATSEPKPIKVIMNLTTDISNLKFNCTSEILAMASSYKEESVKLVHFPSMTVFSNFPTQQKKLNYVNSLDISLNSGYLMLSNNNAKVYLYRLRHYSNY